jgi:predicted SprT family Zn-dependent metalloprotease
VCGMASHSAHVRTAGGLALAVFLCVLLYQSKMKSGSGLHNLIRGRPFSLLTTAAPPDRVRETDCHLFNEYAMSTTTKGLLPCCFQARQLALQLLVTHGLSDWSFAFNRSKRQMGCCRFDPKVIVLSHHFVERNSPDLIRDTLLHEIAHALVGAGHGHDAVWKAMCLRVGAKPERLSNEPDMPQGRWQAICDGCGMRHHKHRRPKRMKGWYCCRCGPTRGALAWSLRPAYQASDGPRADAYERSASPA